MGFHRLTVPSYTGGLPSGYDYINNALSGTPSFVSGQKSGGPNSGTYFVAFGEGASSADANRPSSALAENTDYLDNLFHRDLAVKTRTTVATASGAVASVAVAGAGQYFGETGTPNTVEGIATFCELTDGNGDVIFGTNGYPCRITSITGATPGSGFSSASSITYNVTPSIPSGTTYVVVYALRGNLATIAPNYAAFAKRDGAATTAHIAATQTSSGPFTVPTSSLANQIQAILDVICEQFAVRSIAANDSVDSTGTRDYVIEVTAPNITLNLPDPTANGGRAITLLDPTGILGGPTYAKVTLHRFGSENIGNLASDYFCERKYGTWTIFSDGTNWNFR